MATDLGLQLTLQGPRLTAATRGKQDGDAGVIRATILSHTLCVSGLLESALVLAST